MKSPGTRGLLLAGVLLFSLIVSATGGLLTLAAPAECGVAILTVAASFAATTQLLISILGFVAQPPPADPSPLPQERPRQCG